MTTIQAIEAKFGNTWFHITDLSEVSGMPKTLGIQHTVVAELVADGHLEYFPNTLSMARVKPLVGCEVPPVETAPKFQYGQNVKFVTGHAGAASLFNYGVLIGYDNAILTEFSGALVRILSSDMVSTHERIKNTGALYSYVKWVNLIAIEAAPALSFKKHQLVKVKAENGYNYGYLKYVDDILQIGTFYTLRSDDETVSAMWKANGGQYIQAVKYADLIDIEGSEWNRCGHCHMPYPITELSDTVVSLCDACADIEDFDLIREMNRLHEDGQSIEDYQTINSGRAYEKYMLDMEHWQLKIYKAEKARLAAYRQRIAHEDCLDAVNERREVK